MPFWKKDDNDERLKQTLTFLVKLLILSIPLYLVIWFSIDLYVIQIRAASELEWVLDMAGYDVVRDGASMTVSGGGQDYPFMFFIDEDCTAWKSMLFLFALMVAVPSIRWNRRAVGIAVGLLGLWLGNLFRNVSVVLIERSYGVETAMMIHDWLWRAGLMAMVLVIWLIWWSWARREEKGILSRLHKSKVWRSITRSRS